MNKFILFAAILGGLAGGAIPSQAATTDKPRLLVLTDIGGDPDDQQSMIRLMLYANEFEIEGLIASASGIPGELKEETTKPHLIREIVEAYGKVRQNLAQHAEGYPAAGQLLERIRPGNPKRGREAVGEGHDTEGSRWIVAVADRTDARPLDITIWGGQTDLAQALWRVRKDRGPDGLKSFQAKLRIYDIGDQDKIADWMLDEFPGLFYVLPNPRPGQDRREAAYRGMYLGGDQSLVSRDWMETNIRQNHGPLGALYPPQTWTAPNPYSAIKEGDTPSWFYFLPNGLSDPNHPEWGGWGGRFGFEQGKVWRDTPDTVGEEKHVRVTVWRWRPAFQAGFQARLDWCVQPRAKANHAPLAVVNGDTNLSVLHLRAPAGKAVMLDARGSRDPDSHTLTFRWWQYGEVGTMRNAIAIASPDQALTHVTLPAGKAGETGHLILEVQDSGQPPLTSFRRVIVER